jgi:hypothetical protein
VASLPSVDVFGGSLSSELPEGDIVGDASSGGTVDASLADDPMSGSLDLDLVPTESLVEQGGKSRLVTMQLDTINNNPAMVVALRIIDAMQVRDCQHPRAVA